MSKNEKQIEEEIRKRVLEEEEKIEQLKYADANKEALSEITSLSREDVDRIARNVRGEIAKKQTFYKSAIIFLVLSVIAVAAITAIIVTLKYNNMVLLDEKMKKTWGQVENVYQRRLDLIPNLVATVKGYAAHEKETFKMVTEARAKAGGVLNVSDKILNDPKTFSKFQEAQNELSGVLQRMMLVVERYPELKANQNFLALQAQLEGSENRIAVERKRFNDAVADYNAYIKRFPQVMIAGMFNFSEKAYFEAEKGAKKAPQVSFE